MVFIHRVYKLRCDRSIIYARNTRVRSTTLIVFANTDREYYNNILYYAAHKNPQRRRGHHRLMVFTH